MGQMFGAAKGIISPKFKTITQRSCLGTLKREILTKKMSVVEGCVCEAMNYKHEIKNYPGQKAMGVESRCGGGNETKT